MGKPGHTGLLRILLAARYSAQGFADAWRFEAAFRQETALLIVLTPLAFLLGRTPLEQVALLGCPILVLIVELLNSAIEAAVDRHGDEVHELSGRAKDLGSAAVFLSLLLMSLVWAGVAFERFVTG